MEANYLLIKSVHMVCALVSISLFILRGIWMLVESPSLARRWVKIVPHVNDTLLLLSALLMVYASAQYPFVQAWLTAKVLALLVYILLGLVAFRFARSKVTRAFAWISALFVFAYIVAVARSREIWPILLLN